MIGQFTLVSYSYSMILVFFWALFLALSFGHRLRLVRLERLELGIVVPSNKNVTSKHLLAYVHSPLDEMQVWHNAENHAMPLRYGQTLLFADDLAETHPNPVSQAR